MRAGVVTLLAVVALALPLAGSASVRRISLTTPVHAGDAATLVVAVSPRSVICRITVTYKETVSRAKGLGPKRPKLGRVTWSWKVGSNTTPGRWPIVVDCGKAGKLRTKIRVLP
jgi:micrococcal nuclease